HGRRRGDGRDDRVPAGLPAHVQGDPDAGPDVGDRQRCQALMGLSGLSASLRSSPAASRGLAISDTALPRDVRSGSAGDKRAYKAALGFEKVMLGELVK